MKFAILAMVVTLVCSTVSAKEIKTDPLVTRERLSWAFCKLRASTNTIPKNEMESAKCDEKGPEARARMEAGNAEEIRRMKRVAQIAEQFGVPFVGAGQLVREIAKGYRKVRDYSASN